jgi:phosphoglycerate dehydrogenase-like enzyme
LHDAEYISGRLIVTPHIDYGTLDTYEKFHRETAEDVRAFAKGEPIRVIAG